jgi:hypothetical protein
MTPRHTLLPRTTTLLLLGGLLAAAVGGIVRAAPLGNPAQGDIVISEFRTRGIGGVYDEFVELFNPTGAEIDISGWVLSSSSDCGSVTSDLVTIASPRSLAPGQHYLLASESATAVSADQTWPAAPSSTISDSGGIALFAPGQPLAVDSAGMCATTLFIEGTFLPPLTTNVNRGYERLPGGGLGNCTDSDNNTSDFVLVNLNNPQNATSALTTTCTPATATPTSTSTPTLDPGDTILISEFRTRGPNGEDDELVELYNPGGNMVHLGGWQVRRSSGCGVVIGLLFTIPDNTWLPPGGHFLAASENASISIEPDLVYAAGLFDNGGLALLDSLSRRVDQVGMCATTLYREGSSLPLLPGDLDQGYERNPGGASGSCTDSGDNLADFSLIAPDVPQNLDSPLTPCAGVSTSTPTMTPTSTSTPTKTPTQVTIIPTRTFTRTPTNTRTPTAFPTALPGNVVINEYLPRPASDWNGNGEANSRDEYIELINMGTTAINLQGWKLDDMADSGSSPYTLPNLILPPYGIALYYASETGISLSDGGDTVRLLKPDGHTADLHNYAVVTASDRTWCRLPDGSGAWAFMCRPTPGRPNALIGAVRGDPNEDRPAVRTNCLLPDTIPQAFWLAECGSSGGGIWQHTVDQELWLKKRWKWDVFVE